MEFLQNPNTSFFKYLMLILCLMWILMKPLNSLCLHWNLVLEQILAETSINLLKDGEHQKYRSPIRYFCSRAQNLRQCLVIKNQF